LKIDWDWDEWHAFWIGAFEVMCPWRPRLPISTAQLGYINDEYHYYLWGRATGIVAWVGIAKLVQVIF